MGKFTVNKRDMIALVILIIFGSLAAEAVFCVLSNQPEVFRDIITGMETGYAGNKCEQDIFHAVLLVGVAAIVAYMAFDACKAYAKDVGQMECRSPLFTFSATILVGLLVNYLIYRTVNWFLIALLIWGFGSFIRATGGLLDNICVFLVAWLDIIVVVEIFFMMGKSVSNQDMVCLLFALLLATSILLLKKYFPLHTLMFAMQLPLPMLMLVFLNDRYKYNGEVISFSFPTGYSVFMITAMVLWFGLIIRDFQKWRQGAQKNFVSIGACIPTVLFFSGYQEHITGIVELVVYAGKDAAEQVIGFQQMLRGSRLFADYYPLSGLFSVPIGGILEALGGTFELEYAASTIFRTVIFCVLVYLLSQYLDNRWLLLFSVCFIIPTYDRFYVVILGFLVLYLPKLVDQCDLWIKSWVWVCMLTGLFYPMYGVALLCGSLPLGIQQIKRWPRLYSGKRWVKAPILISWGATLLVVAAVLPLVYRMAKHLLVYSEDSVQALTGIPLRNRALSNRIMACVPEPLIRYGLYFFLAFALPLAYAWICWFILIRAIKKGGMRGRFAQEWFCAFVLVLFSAMESVRRSNFPSKNWLYIAPIIIMVLLMRSVEMDRFGRLMMGIIVFFSCIGGYAQTGQLKGYLIKPYAISSEYVNLEENDFPRLGDKGFIKKDYWETLTDLRDKVARIHAVAPDVSFTMLPGSYSTIYILDLPAFGQLSPNEMTNNSTWQQMKALILEKRPVIGTGFKGDLTYRLYRWLLTSGEYRYSEEFGMFLPQEIYMALGLNEEFDYSRIPISKWGNIYQMASKFGRSIETLKNALIVSDAEVTVECVSADTDGTNGTRYRCAVNEPVDGAEFDFLFVKLRTDDEEKKPNIKQMLGIEEEEDCKVRVEWTDERSEKLYHIDCAMGNGALLIPVGTVGNWLLNDHSEFMISVDRKGVQIEEMYFAGIENK